MLLFTGSGKRHAADCVRGELLGKQGAYYEKSNTHIDCAILIFATGILGGLPYGIFLPGSAFEGKGLRNC